MNLNAGMVMMAQTSLLKNRIAAAAICALGLAATTQASAEVNMFDGEWHASVTPYL